MIMYRKALIHQHVIVLLARDEQPHDLCNDNQAAMTTMTIIPITIFV